MTLNSDYDEISSLILSENFIYFGYVPNLQHLASINNIIFLIVDKFGNSFTAEVFYDPVSEKISPPTGYFSLELLPKDMLHETVINLSRKDINSLCSTNKNLNMKICDDDDFWKKKYMKDFEFDITTKDIMEATSIPWKIRYTTNRNVYSFGDGSYGQLGVGINTGIDIYQLIKDIKAKTIATGDYHSLILDLDGNVWSFGINDYGQLGLNNYINVTIPTKIPNIKAKDISAGGESSSIIDLNDNVWVFGNNMFGQLGLGDLYGTNNILKPIQIPNIKVKNISIGDHTLIIDLEDNVLSFGDNELGQLGLDDVKMRYSPTIIPNMKAKAISVGNYSSLIIDMEDNVWSFGDGSYGQLGLGAEFDIDNNTIPNKISNIKAKYISTNGRTSFIIDLDDNIWSFGNNNNGQSGFSDLLNRDEPELIKDIKAKYVYVGHNHTLIIDLDDNAFVMGSNKKGQLGLHYDFDALSITKLEDHIGVDYVKVRSASLGEDYTLIILKS